MSNDNTNGRAVAVRDETAVARQNLSLAIEKLVVMGNLADLTPEQRVAHYKATCQAVGVDWIARPFDYIVLDGKLTLYANQNCASQLRDARSVDTRILSRDEVGDLYIVTVSARLPNGRTEEATGAVSLVVEGGEWKTAQSGKRYFAGNGQWTKMRGTDLANAIMKAETKAKRRATFNLCGLGAFADEPQGEQVDIETRTGEIVQPDPREQQPLQTPKAASKRFHTRPEGPVLVPVEDSETGDVYVVEEQQEQSAEDQADQSAVNPYLAEIADRLLMQNPVKIKDLDARVKTVTARAKLAGLPPVATLAATIQRAMGLPSPVEWGEVDGRIIHFLTEAEGTDIEGLRTIRVEG